MSRIIAKYRLAYTGEDARELATKIAWEQTVEIPVGQAPRAEIEHQIVGRVERVTEAQDHAIATISFAPQLAGNNASQLFNLAYGNISMMPGIRLTDLKLPDATAVALGGPGHGISGLRRLTGAYDRPLFSTAVKPRGLTTKEMAELAGQFASGGGDLIKDDQNLCDEKDADFFDRVERIANAVANANAANNGHCVYFPHLAGRLDQLETRLEFIASIGLRGVLVCPMIVGLEAMRGWSRQYGLLMMAHPALTGAFTNGVEHGIDPQVLLGLLFRLSGADISVFPGTGGRFAYTKEACAAVRQAVTQPLHGLDATMPCPAGGMTFESIPGLCDDYGQDVMLLIGGALLSRGPDLATATAEYMAAIQSHFPGRMEATPEPAESACEWPAATRSAIQSLLRRTESGWTHRAPTRYKDQSASFAGVQRFELIGQHGEPCQFELRYFEVEPGGFTSLEHHRHIHAIIGAFGQGQLISGQETEELKPNDIGYVAPEVTHQLRNTGTVPFGFYCIVDRDRDRPVLMGR